MGDDILHSYNCSHISSAIISDDLLKDQILLEIEKILVSSTPSKTLSDFSLPAPSRRNAFIFQNRILLEERSYDTLELHQQYLFMSTQLNAEQKKVYDQIHLSATYDIQSLIFVYGHGGTGKTFFWSTILSYLRSRGLIVLAVAASGIASLLLPAGRTAHSRLKIPLDLSDTSTCHIKKKTHLGQLLQETFAIVWDEATMNERKCFECVDRTLKDILDKPNLPFGGMTMLVGGDFRQTLPVKPKLRPAEVVACTLPNSPLWRYFTVCPLLYNMRLSRSNDNGSVLAAKQAFASWLVDIGNGIVGVPSSEDLENISVVDIPNHLLSHRGW